jgi:pyruvate dehydrogenase E2 component (dihydrolipoamide acetyltransferase)
MSETAQESKLQTFLATFGPVGRQPLERMQKIGAKRLGDSWRTVPHVTHHDDADITALEAWRTEAKGTASQVVAGPISLLALVAAALAKTLRAFPIFNSSSDADIGDLVVRDYINIGFAIDTAKGLVIGVVRDCCDKSPVQISAEIQALANKARQSNLNLAESSGSCFTISSLGALGGRYFSPIINLPEVAILGVSATYDLPKRGKQDQLLWGKALPLSLSYDHRVINGADAGRFIKRLIEELTHLPDAR